MVTIDSYFCSKMGTNFVKVCDDIEYELPDPMYVDGAIELFVDNVAIFDKAMWDLVDQLWGYIINSLETLATAGVATSYFPDQPLKFTFERIGQGKIRVSSYPSKEPRTAVVGERAFIEAVQASGLLFCEVMARLDSASSDLHQEQAQRLRSL